MVVMTEGKHVTALSLPALVLSALLGLGATGCGVATNTGRSSSSTSSSVAARPAAGPITTSLIPAGQHVRGDGDADNPSDIDGNGDRDITSVAGSDGDNDNPTGESYRFPDNDDKDTFAYGRPPSASVRRAIANVVTRYYAAASVDDAATACGLLLPSLARSVGEEGGGPFGSSRQRGDRTCQGMASMLFRQSHGVLAAAIKVVEMRVHGASAQVIFSSRTMRASNTFLTRQGNAWQLLEVLGRPLP
jgi:hypothetical protein